MMTYLQENLAAVVVFALVMAFIVIPLLGGAVAGFRARMSQCHHKNPASFRYGPEGGYVLHHCFTCGCTKLEHNPWEDRGIRSGNELNEWLAELDDITTPDNYEPAADALPDDLPPPLPLTERIRGLLVGTKLGDDGPNAVVLGKAELMECLPVLISGLERNEDFRLAAKMKQFKGDWHDKEAIHLFRHVRLFHLAVIPNLKAESIIALASV